MTLNLETGLIKPRFFSRLSSSQNCNLRMELYPTFSILIVTPPPLYLLYHYHLKIESGKRVNSCTEIFGFGFTCHIIETHLL